MNVKHDMDGVGTKSGESAGTSCTSTPSDEQELRERIRAKNDELRILLTAYTNAQNHLRTFIDHTRDGYAEAARVHDQAHDRYFHALAIRNQMLIGRTEANE